MRDKILEIKRRYDEVTELLSQQEVISDGEKYTLLTKEHAQLSPLMEHGEKMLSAQREIDEAKELLLSDDEELKEMARMQLEEAQELLEALSEEYQRMLLPRDPNDDKNVVLEIRAGTGGDEAALFGMDLFRMYSRFAERQNWKMEVVSLSDTELGGVKEAVLLIAGKGAFSYLKYESGAHRVQRVPSTESGGRIHTSAATVAVLPEIEDVQVDIRPQDLKIDTYRSGGAGGQHVNKTESAIRITHLPTGLVVTCQDEKSQIKNRETAMRVLKSRLYDHYYQQQHDQYSQNRKSQIGSGDRSERIRTYNFPQNRVTDHRINLTLYRLDTFMDGDMQEMLMALRLADEAQKIDQMAAGNE
ncbi:MAG: peptide chain release factor 1 [Christensenellales bacterium]|jgi:peptide chain release factor 1